MNICNTKKPFLGLLLCVDGSDFLKMNILNCDRVLRYLLWNFNDPFVNFFFASVSLVKVTFFYVFCYDVTFSFMFVSFFKLMI